MSSRLRPGQTLIEVVIASLIAAITTMAVFSVILSSFVAQKKGDKREQLAMVLRNAQQTLQSFVSAVPEDSKYSPNAGGIWSADSSRSWALAAGRHDISSLLNGTELQTPGVTCADGADCYFVYTVEDDNSAGCAGGKMVDLVHPENNTKLACKKVTFSVKYAD